MTALLIALLAGPFAWAEETAPVPPSAPGEDSPAPSEPESEEEDSGVAGGVQGGVVGGHPDVWIPHETYTLDNGLNVILSEDHSVPFVWVNLWYNVGSKDEEEGRTGFAHLFEHLMFQGSENMNDDYFVPLQKVGARINGTTNFDRTNYFEGVPSEHLPLAVWLEADRMGWLLPALDETKLQNQKDVVRNERRQRYENRPYGMVWVWLFESLYPQEHPYHVPTIGKHEDIDAATLADTKTFFQTWYVPNNASLSIAGDFDPAEVKALIETYFGPIPKGPQPTPVSDAPASLTEETVVRKADDVPHHKVWMAWLTPRLFAEGDAEMDILASLLADGKESRLYARLVHEKKICKDISAFQYSAQLQSQFLITATAAAGHTTDEVVKEIDLVLADMGAQGVSDKEVDVAKANWEAHFYDGLQTISSKSNTLNNYYIRTGDAGYITKDLARYQGVTAASTHSAFERWLGTERVVLHVTPKAEEE